MRHSKHMGGHEATARRISAFSLAASAILALVKISVGMAANSTAVISDGVESASDCLTSGLILLGLWIASKPSDSDHPYGHGRFEILTGLTMGVLLAVVGTGICLQSLRERGVSHTPAAYAIWPLLLSIGVKALFASAKFRAGRRTGSSSIRADAWHDLLDLSSGLVALAGVSLALMNAAFAAADHYAGFAIGVIVIFVGLRVARETVLQLTDTMPDARQMGEIRAAALRVPGAMGVEKCFARKTGLRYHVDLHLEVNPEMTVRESHDIATSVRNAVRNEVPWVEDVLIHVEPYGTLGVEPLEQRRPQTIMENRAIARMLAETADLMEIAAEDSFRIRSYRTAAEAIQSYPEQLSVILKDPAKKLTDIPGVGKGIAAVVQEIEERGSFERRDEMLSKYPASLLELFSIQGLGPKSVRLLFDTYRVQTVDDLERICKEQKLRELPRMGAKLEEKVLRSIGSYRQTQGRFLLSFGQRVADELIQYLSAVPGVVSVVPAGSLRRGKETIGDLDLLATGPGAADALEKFVAHPKVHEVLGKGANKASIKFGLEGLQVDLRALPSENYGAALQYFTGSKEHSVALRSRAQKMGLTLNEYGLAQVEGGKIVASATEEKIYAALGLDWIPPELRENAGEIDAAAEHRLPRLLTRVQIRGDLHMHTTETDGRATLEEMAEAAREAGHEYIAITDHSKALAMANGLDEKRAIAFAHRIKERKSDDLGIRIFSGIECDIRRDGKMDLDDDALAELDWVIGSVHSYMNLEPAEMTDRLMRALECPHLRVLGHPTGRILLHRDSFPFDFDLIATEASRRHVLFEINASPERLDLSAPLIRAAKAKGCQFVISTDAHQQKHLANMEYGVRMARRGWLEAADVVNTRSAADFAKFLAHK